MDATSLSKYIVAETELKLLKENEFSSISDLSSSPF